MKPQGWISSHLMKDEVLPELSGELGHSFDGDFGGVVEIIDYYDLDSAQKELKDGVAADVSSSAGD